MYYHLIVVHNPDTGMAAQVLIEHPDRADVPDEAVAEFAASVVDLIGAGRLKGWSHTWDHEPTDAERDEYLPEGLRSTDEHEIIASASTDDDA
jgi:hypothetical protein